MRKIFFIFSFIAFYAFAEELYLEDMEEIAFHDFLIKQTLKVFEPKEQEPFVPVDRAFTVDLKNPKFRDGILYTDEGGIIQNDEMRIAARCIQYIKREEEGKPVHRIEAEGDLIVQFKGRVYVGEELEFDFDTKTGTIWNGKTYSPPFYVGGEKIVIKSDGTYRVETASLTSCENQKSTWDIHAGQLNVKKNDLLEAKRVRFRFFNFTTLILPYLKLNLRKFQEPILKYKLTWDKSSGPKISLRYQVYSWRNFALYVRGEYRLKRGFGGALETEYFPKDHLTTFVTRSYVATDAIPTNLFIKRRYRLQGELHSISKSKKTTLDLTWDKFSDVLMPGDFKFDDFELNTAKKTQFNLRHQQDDMIGILYARPRVNSFETIKQEIPTVFAAMRPLSLGFSKIVSENWLKLSYLDLAYSNDLVATLPNFHSGRLETHNEIYRAFHFGSFVLNPYVGIVGIYYTNNQEDKPIGFGLIKYGTLAKLNLERDFHRYRHLLEPYLLLDGYTKPTTPVDDHFIFSIQDGYTKQILVKGGIKNFLFSRIHPRATASFSSDLYAHAFIEEQNIKRLIPRLYLNLQWDLSSISIDSFSSWSFWHHTLQFSNLRARWTINEDAAISFEIRYRSKYEWRKAYEDNFMLDLTRPEDQLLASPLSDRRFTIITHFFFRVTPFWTAHIHFHNGFLRKGQPPFTEFKIDLFTWISSSWKVRVSYLHTQRDDRVTAGIELVKK